MENSFIINQKELSSILSSMQPICTKRTTMDATASVLFQATHKELVVKSTDLEISLQYSCAIKDSSIEEGQTFLVSGKRVFDLIRELEGDIKFNLENNQIALQSGFAHLSLNIKDSQEFPSFPERIENLMQMDTSLLLTMLDKVSFLIPQNNSNPALNGLFVEISPTEFKMTATDGHCLSQVITTKCTLGELKSWLLPRRAIYELKKILENVEDTMIFLGTCGNQLVFSGQSFNFFTKLLAEPFPQYAPILNKTGFDKGIVNKAHLIKTLRRSTSLLSGQFIATKLDFNGKKVDVSLLNKEVGALQEQLILDEFIEKTLSIRFYAPYLINGLQVFNDERIVFYLNNNLRPIIFESVEKDVNFTYLIMPVSQSQG